MLSPGPVATPIFDKMGLPQEVLDHRDEVLLADVPMKRFGLTHEIARDAVFLASDDSTFMAGSELVHRTRRFDCSGPAATTAFSVTFCPGGIMTVAGSTVTPLTLFAGFGAAAF